MVVFQQICYHQLPATRPRLLSLLVENGVIPYLIILTFIWRNQECGFLVETDIENMRNNYW